jgi:hypothetical protein
MCGRLTALFLACVLLWSGLSTIELPSVLAHPSQGQSLAIFQAGGQAAGHHGSVEHHHLDDLPLQAQSDTPTEPPGMLPATATPRVPSLVMAQPRAYALAEALPPFLAGPLRPPCSAALAG